MLSEVAQRHVGRQVVLGDLTRRTGDEHLPAVGGGADARGAGDADADVALAADRRLAGVDAHPHPERVVLGPLRLGKRPLRRDGCGDRSCARAGTPRRMRPPACRRSALPRRRSRRAGCGRVRQEPARSCSRRRLRSRVDPSMSVKRKVTVPAGSSIRTCPGSMPCSSAIPNPRVDGRMPGPSTGARLEQAVAGEGRERAALGFTTVQRTGQ